MNNKPKKRILYGEANYKNMVDKNGYYVDKTGFIPLLEDYGSPVFLRPRRFGKSLWCTTLASGYNIADFLTLKEKFETMMGFTQQETDKLIDEIYRDYEIDPATRPLIKEVITSNYNGYRIVDPDGEGLFNSTILMYFMREFIEYKKIPDYLIDVNLKTDISWVKRLTASNPADTGELVNQLLIENRLSYNKLALLEKFNLSQFFEKSFYPISFYYLGMVTKRDDQYMCLPNLNMRSIFVDYFNEINKIDVSTRYAELMAGFINHPDIPKLFAGYWELYVSQLPEAIFQQVNENFYRTTFFDLCRQHLSGYFTWALEKSYAGGRTDLEFIGKYHTKFAGLRYLLEFKYYSNARWNKISRGLPAAAGEKKNGQTGEPGSSKKTGRKNVTKISQFQALEKDIKQLKAYGAEWKKQHPQPGNKSFLVYCFGNRGFRVFPV